MSDSGGAGFIISGYDNYTVTYTVNTSNGTSTFTYQTISTNIVNGAVMPFTSQFMLPNTILKVNGTNAAQFYFNMYYPSIVKNPNNTYFDYQYFSNYSVWNNKTNTLNPAVTWETDDDSVSPALQAVVMSSVTIP